MPPLSSSALELLAAVGRDEIVRMLTEGAARRDHGSGAAAAGRGGAGWSVLIRRLRPGAAAPNPAAPHLREPAKKEREEGLEVFRKVVNVSSMYGVVAPDLSIYAAEAHRNPPFYGTAKAAMLQLTRYAAAELGPDGGPANPASVLRR